MDNKNLGPTSSFGKSTSVGKIKIWGSGSLSSAGIVGGDRVAHKTLNFVTVGSKLVKSLYAWTLEVTKFLYRWGVSTHEIMRMEEEEYITVT